MRTFHPKEALFHMEEGWMLVEEGLFHPEEPSFLIWMAMMLPKEGTFLAGEGAVLLFQPPVLLDQGLFLPEDRSMLPDEELFHSAWPSFLVRKVIMLSKEGAYFSSVGLFLLEVRSAHPVYGRDAVLGVWGATSFCRKPPLNRRSFRRPGTAALRTAAAEELLHQASPISIRAAASSLANL